MGINFYINFREITGRSPRRVSIESLGKVCRANKMTATDMTTYIRRWFSAREVGPDVWFLHHKKAQLAS